MSDTTPPPAVRRRSPGLMASQISRPPSGGVGTGWDDDLTVYTDAPGTAVTPAPPNVIDAEAPPATTESPATAGPVPVVEPQVPVPASGATQPVASSAGSPGGPRRSIEPVPEETPSRRELRLEQKAARKADKQAARDQKKKARKGGDADADGATETSDEPVEAGQLRVVRPGAKLRGARKVAVGLKVAIVALATVTIAGGAVVGGMVVGGNLANPHTELSDDQAAVWHLDRFNTTQAVTVAERYLRTCLTRYADLTADRARKDETTIINATGTDPACDGGNSSQVDVAVTQIVFAGTSAADDPRVTDQVRMVAFDAATTASTTLRYVVPVWLADPAGGAGARVVGNLGVMPVPLLGAPAAPSDTLPTDSTLAGELDDQFIPEFMAAWAATAPALEQFLASDASEAARQGLAGWNGVPTVRQVTVIGDGDGTYPEGATVQVRVETEFAMPGSTATSGSMYRVTIRKAGDHWFVTDVAGGVAGFPNTTSGAPTVTPKPTPTVTPETVQPAPAGQDTATPSEETPPPDEADTQEVANTTNEE